jgi:hypothetical protein
MTNSHLNYYQLLNLSKSANKKDVEKAFRELSLKWHPDRYKNSSAKKIAEETYKIMTVAHDTLIDEVKRKEYDDSIGIYFETTNIHSSEKVYAIADSIGWNRYVSNSRISQNQRFTLFFVDGYTLIQQNFEKWINGKVWLEESNFIFWIKEIERPTNAAVSNTGRVALLLDTASLDYSKSASNKVQEFIDLGGKLIIIEKTGEEIFTYDFGSNIEGCDISPDGNVVSVSSAAPDNSVYCFDVQQKKLLWKYKNHARRIVLKLLFNEHNIDVYTGHSTATINKEYSLQINGNLTPPYAKEKEIIETIKKQPPKQKYISLIDMINSGERRKIFESLWQLTSFVSTKGSFPFHTRIIEVLNHFVKTDDEEIFDIVWKIIRGILKKQPQVLTPIIPAIISKFKYNSSKDYEDLLRYLGELGGVNPQWIINELPLIKQKIRSNYWNEQMRAGFAIGSIGSNNVSLIEEVIPIMIDYITNIDEGDSSTKKFNNCNDLNLMTKEKEYNLIVRDAFIDALGLIGKNFPESIREAIPLLENLVNNSSSPYTIKKAQKVIDIMNKK